MGLKGKRTQTVKELKSPMPGLVFRILKSEGDEVVAGETILILEAMKMENSIKSPGNGRIKSIPVKEGQSIEKEVSWYSLNNRRQTGISEPPAN